MNTLFIIGNGFDIKLGLKTKYTQFIEHYKNIESNLKQVNKLKKTISNDIEKWSDLELELGKYTNYIHSVEEFNEIYYDLADKLADYLENEENNFLISNVMIDRIKNSLCYPEIFLSREDTVEINDFKKQWPNRDTQVDIISLNYTRTIEKILNKENKNLHIGNDSNGKNISLRNIYHIHGYTDSRMVLGVNDEKQIGNRALLEIAEINETIIKSECNRVQKHLIDRDCLNLINKANLICIFGSSIGETDKYIWQNVSNRLLDGGRLIIFDYAENLSQRFSHRKAPLERKTREKFLSKIELTNNEKDVVRMNTFVEINSDIFKFF